MDKVYDDGPEDSDQTPGQVTLYGMVNGQYKICQIMTAQGFLMPPTRPCFSGVLNPGGQLTGTFFNPWPPYPQWTATNDVGTLVGGGSKFTLKDSVGAGWTITDDNPLSDNNPWEGGLQSSVSHPGTWTICEIAAPVGYVKPAGQPCVNIVVDWAAYVTYNSPAFVGLVHHSSSAGLQTLDTRPTPEKQTPVSEWLGVFSFQS